MPDKSNQRPLPKSRHRQVRLFPLPELVLFPGVVEPLHIFESRYVELIEDALAQDGLITMATLKPGYDDQTEYFGRPELESPVCIGRIISHQQTERGTYVFMLAGMHRARILEELPALRSYREAVVEVLQDVAVPDRNTEQQLRRDLITELSRRNAVPADLLDKLAPEAVPLSAFIDAIAFCVQLDRDTRLTLLEEPTVETRVTKVLTALRKTDPLD